MDFKSYLKVFETNTLNKYDRVEWQFLKGIMEKMGFPALWIERVMNCVTTPTFSILVNGKPYGMIHP